MNHIQRLYLQELLDGCVKRDVFPGAVLLVHHKGTNEFFVTGKQELLPTIKENQMDTLYDLASLSKVISTTPLILKACAAGLISLATPLHTILPEFIHEDILIQHLLTHTSGLPSDIAIDIHAEKEVLRKKCMQCAKIYETGTQVLYSDVNFILLGFCLEKLYQQPLNQLASTLIFDPLDMKNTGYCPDVSFYERCAATEISLYDHQLIKGKAHDRKATIMKGVSGHAGVFSTIQDMSHFVEMLLQQGTYHGVPCLREKDIDLFSTCMSPDGYPKRSIGFLLKDKNTIFADTNSEKAYGHTGFTGTSILIDPVLQLGIVLLSNRIHPSRKQTKILQERKLIHENIIKLLSENGALSIMN